MSGKRKDSKGRVLKVGESQRKDGSYQYRYTDIRGKRISIYANDLNKLREKELELTKNRLDGIDYASGLKTVSQLVGQYIELKQGVRDNTKKLYNYVLRTIQNDDFGHRKIKDIKLTDAQRWVVKLNNSGKSYNTIAKFKSVLKPAFQMACDEDAIRKNPFNFNLSDFVNNNSKARIALTEEQQKQWLDFIYNDEIYNKYYDEYVVLLGTGMRASELCGLTIDDLDFENRKIRIERQLLKKTGAEGRLYIGEPKSKSAYRYVPMTPEVFKSLRNALEKRKRLVKKEVVVDGCSGFVFVSESGNPKIATTMVKKITGAQKRYEKLHPDEPLPFISLHILRHTFCTNMMNAGMNIKSLQYIMGHASADITLNVYAHTSFESAEKEMAKVIDIRQFVTPKGDTELTNKITTTA